ncbi:MAG: hypothetical protein KDC26_07810 [Armatimonadetes bacterium]|nr:hypothetical protein [Armatimonadota bacterium]
MISTLLTSVLFVNQNFDRIDPAETYGKSAHEIVKMGHEKWFDFYTNAEEGGQSTMGMSYANMYFGTAMRQVNNERMAGNEKLEEKSAYLRKNLDQFHFNMIDVGRAFTGGGTLWNLVSSSVRANTEEVILSFIEQSSPKPPRTQAEVWKMIGETEKNLTEMKSEIDETKGMTGLTYDEVRLSLANGKIMFAGAMKQIASWPSNERKAVITGFYDAVNDVNFMSGE